MTSCSTSQPSGGTLGVFEFANSMAVLGHEVHLIHVDLLGTWVHGIDELRWFEFDERIAHHFGREPHEVEIAGSEVVIGSDDRIPDHLGEPAMFIQAYRILPPPEERGIYGRACPKLCTSTWLRDVAVHLGNPPGQTFHLPYGLRHDKYRPAVPVEERRRRVAYLYNHHPLKRSEVGVEVVHQLRRDDPTIEVVVFGIGKRPETLDESIPYVFDPTQDVLVRELYGDAAVFFTTAQLEGFGLAPLESMACGCALVTTDNGGSWDYAEDGRTAVVTPFDAEPIAARVRELLDDDERRMAIARNGIELAQRYDWATSGQRLEAILEAYVADPASYQQPVASTYDDELIIWAAQVRRSRATG